jgi:lysophospholipase L1-like esterase
VQKTQTEAKLYRQVRRSEFTKIVALGDSLTLGETDFGLSLAVPVIAFPAYLGVLAEEYLRTRHSNLAVQVVNKGVDGDLTSGMFERFSSDVADQRADYVIVLGGTNDIGWGLDLMTILHNLTSIYDAAGSDDIGAIACSVPSLLGFDELIPPRLDLNRAIRKEAEKRKISFLDLFTATANARNNRLLEDYSSDGLHLNSKGYERIGKYIFDEWLKTILDRTLGSDT